MYQVFLHIFTYYISFRDWYSFPVYHVFLTGLRVSCVSYNRLGFAAVTNDLRVSTAYSKKKVRFFQVGCGFSPLCLGPRVTE